MIVFSPYFLTFYTPKDSSIINANLSGSADSTLSLVVPEIMQTKVMFSNHYCNAYVCVCVCRGHFRRKKKVGEVGVHGENLF